MRLTFLGKDTLNGGSPTLFAADGGGYVAQGYRVPGDESSVEIPKKLLTFLEEGTRLDARLRDTGRGSYILTGKVVTDPEALAQMDIPAHETAVEVDKVREDGSNGSLAG
jgi:hypothetical protein